MKRQSAQRQEKGRTRKKTKRGEEGQGKEGKRKGKGLEAIVGIPNTEDLGLLQQKQDGSDDPSDSSVVVNELLAVCGHLRDKKGGRRKERKRNVHCLSVQDELHSTPL